MWTWSLQTGTRLVLKRGDLTRSDVDAIVNAANPLMLGGGGVDGAIHRAAGPKLLAACRRVKAHRGIRCPVGEARITPGFDLHARHVIHTVGPVWRRSSNPEGELACAYTSSLALARQHHLRSVAFPAISCGAYGFPLPDAARVALATVIQQAQGLDEVRFVLFDTAAWDAFGSAAAVLLGPPHEA